MRRIVNALALADFRSRFPWCYRAPASHIALLHRTACASCHWVLDDGEKVLARPEWGHESKEEAQGTRGVWSMEEPHRYRDKLETSLQIRSVAYLTDCCWYSMRC